MTHSPINGNAARILGPLAGLVGLALVSTMPVAAQSACQDGNNVIVEFLGVGASNTILTAQVEGGYQGDVLVKVYCGFDDSPVTDAIITFSTNVPNSSILLDGEWTSAAAPGVEVAVPSGQRVVTIRSSDPELTGWKAKVGTSTVIVTGAYGSGLPGNEYPTVSSGIWAQTPELGSLALFGSGAAGMAGYALMRLRAARSRERRA